VAQSYICFGLIRPARSSVLHAKYKRWF